MNANDAAREVALKRLRACATDWDLEEAHRAADEALCELLIALGYGDVVTAWSKVDKWYA